MRDLKETEALEGIGENTRFLKIHTTYTCPEPQIVPVTFVKPDSFAKLGGYEGSTTLNVSLAFRSYEEKGLIMFHKFITDGFVKVRNSFFYLIRDKVIFRLCLYKEGVEFLICCRMSTHIDKF